MLVDLAGSQPLWGRRIVVTRSQAQAGALCQRLSDLGAEPIAIPTIAFAPLPSEPLAAALRQLEQYQWLIFTSGNAVDFFFRAMPGDLPAGLRVAASGSATAGRLQERGITPDFVPAEFVGEQLAAGLGDLCGQRALLPRARQGRREIVALLEAQGAVVDDIALYDTVIAKPAPDALARLAAGVDAVTFTSPSSVRNYLQILADAGLPFGPARVVCIGPITAAAARECGVAVDAVAEAYTVGGLVEALVGFFATNLGNGVG